MTVALKINQGMVTVEDVKIEGAAVVLGLAGSASIPARELDLKGTAALVTPPKPGATPFELPFIVQGSWDDPIMLPDPEIADPPVRRRRAAAQCRTRAQHARFGSLGHRAADRQHASGRHRSGRDAGDPGKNRVTATRRAQGWCFRLSSYQRRITRRRGLARWGGGCCILSFALWSRSSSPR